MTTPPSGAQTWPDDVQVDPVSQQGLQGYAQARNQLAAFEVPRLVSADQPHRRMFVANFDGTGNDKYDDPKHITNIGILEDQLFASKLPSIGHGYVTGVGSSPDWASQNLDGGLGYSYGPRMEEMYLRFVTKAKEWKEADPKAEISILSTGFSRGAVTAAMFTRMVEERGIQNPDGMKIDKDAQGHILKLTPSKPDLVPPGQTRQAVVLLDPVATGVMNVQDVRLAPSVVSGLQITANNESRDAFYGKQIIDPGLSKDGRFLNVAVNGAHCDIGGSYLLNGLSTRNFNLMSAYVNGLSDRPFSQALTVPSAPEMNVVHHSEQHRNFYTTAFADLTGQRMQVRDLAGDNMMTLNRFGPEPVESGLMNGLERHRVRMPDERLDPSIPTWLQQGPSIPEPAAPRVDSWTPMFLNAPMSQQNTAPAIDPRGHQETPAGFQWDRRFLAATDAALRHDAQGINAVGRDYAQSAQGQQWLQQGVTFNQQQERQAALEQQAALQAQTPQAPAYAAPVLRIG